MINVNSLQDLRQFGVNTLTGEACRLGMRLLCDLSEQGEELVCEFLGLPYGTELAPNWNTTVGDQPAKSSIMLTRDSLWELAKFAMLKDHDMVMQRGVSGTLSAFNYDDPRASAAESLISSLDNWTIFRNPYRSGNSSGTRNTHEMTGRTV
jgi:hypothetical protein